jgi:hypothetical protein
MSVPVEVALLRAELEGENGAAFLVTVGDGGTPHVVSVLVSWQGERLAVGAGRRTAQNVASRPGVTLLWPAPEGPTTAERGMSLLIDGQGEVVGEQVLVTPTSAIRHRSVTGPDGSRRSDCIELPDVAGEA